MKLSPTLRLGLSTSLAPIAAYAAGPAVPIVTVTATRIPTPVSQTPAGVTVITKQEMIDRGYTTLEQALVAVPGLGIVQSGGPGGQASVFIRGTNSEDVLVLQDGVPINDPSDPNGAFDFGQDLLAGIERVEIIRGPLSGLYGSSAIGGVINLITLQGSGKPQAQLTVEGGFPAQAKGTASISGTSGKLDYAISGALDEEAGFDATARRLSVYADNRDPFRSKSGAVQLGYTPVAGTRIYVILRGRDTDSAFPDLGFPIFDDPDETSHETSAFGKIGVKSDLFDHALTTELFVARLQDDRHFKNLLDGDDPNFASADDHYHGYRTDTQWTNVLRLPDAGPARDSALQFGIDHIDDNAKQDVDESGFLEDVDHGQHSTSGHVGGQTTLYNRLTVTAAARDDAVSSFGNAVTGRVGGVLAIPEADIKLKSSYGTGFLAPSLFDLYGTESFDGFQSYMGNPNLKAERSNGYEAGAEFDLPFTVLNVTYFANNIHDLIEPTDDFSSEQNIDRARINGVEGEVLVTPADWLSADLTYTYTNAEDAGTHHQLERRPHNAGSATVTFHPTPQISIVPEIRYIGAFSDFLYDNSGFPTSTGTAEPGTILDLTANYQVTPRLAVFMQAKNLTNSPFEPVNGLQIPGTSALFGIRVSTQ